MKKIVKVLSAAVLVVMLGVTLVACGGVKGTYECEITVMGSTVTTTLELKDGDKCVMSANAGGISSEKEGTYKVDGDKITLTVGANSVTGTLKDGKITIAMEGEGSTEITYTKK